MYQSIHPCKRLSSPAWDAPLTIEDRLCSDPCTSPTQINTIGCTWRFMQVHAATSLEYHWFEQAAHTGAAQNTYIPNMSSLLNCARLWSSWKHWYPKLSIGNTLKAFTVISLEVTVNNSSKIISLNSAFALICNMCITFVSICRHIRHMHLCSYVHVCGGRGIKKMFHIFYVLYFTFTFFYIWLYFYPIGVKSPHVIAYCNDRFSLMKHQESVRPLMSPLLSNKANGSHVLPSINFLIFHSRRGQWQLKPEVM